jgi:hypothetical protein
VAAQVVGRWESSGRWCGSAVDYFAGSAEQGGVAGEVAGGLGGEGAAGEQVEPGVDPGERGPRGMLTDPIPSAGQDLTLSATPDASPPAVHPPNPQRAQRIPGPPRVRDSCPFLHDQRRRGGAWGC